MARFSEVAGQFFSVDRPPRGYITAIDHEGRAVCVAVDALETLTGSLLEAELEAQPKRSVLGPNPPQPNPEEE